MAERPSTGTIKAGHELSGANSRGIFWFIFFFILMSALLHLVLWLTLGAMHRHEVKREPGESPLGSVRPRDLEQPLQPAPGHPTVPAQDLAEMKAEQLQELHSYGPVQGDPGHVHIPIERAMQMLLESGALKQPVKGAETQPYINPTTQPSTENRT